MCRTWHTSKLRSFRDPIVRQRQLNAPVAASSLHEFRRFHQPTAITRNEADTGPAPPIARSVRPSRLGPPRSGSEGEASTNCRSNVVLVEIRDAGAVRNGDGQTAADVGICNAGISVETLGEVMIRIERNLVEEARAGSAETRGRAGRRNTEVVLPLMIGRTK